MTKGTESKNKILACAGHLFVKNGYHATGIQQILNESGLPKGSFYYYFQGKEDLAVQVCTFYKEFIQEIFQDAAAEKDWSGFVSHFTSRLKKQMEDGILYGCPIAVIGMETAQTEKKIAAVCQEMLDELTRGFQSILMRYMVPLEEAEKKARVLMEMYEGILLYYRISQDLTVFEHMREQFHAI